MGRSIYWRRATKAGAYAGFIGGLIVTGVLSWYYPDWIPQLGGVQAGIVGLIVNVALMVGVSLLTKPDPYVQDRSYLCLQFIWRHFRAVSFSRQPQG